MNHVVNLSPTNLLNVTAILILSLALPAEGNEDDLYFLAVNHPERQPSDFAYDEKCKPLDVSPFTQITEGDQVLELGSGVLHNRIVVLARGKIWKSLCTFSLSKRAPCR